MSGPASPPSLRATAVGILTGIVAIAFENISVATAMPAAAASLGAAELYAWNFTLFVLGLLISTVVAGRYADRHGPVVPLAFGIAVFATGLIVAGSATTMAQLMAGRGVQGVGAGAMNLGLYVVIARGFPERLRAVMMTWFSAAWMLPAFVGPPVAAWITTTWSWHWVFYGVLPLLALTVVLAGPALWRQQASGAFAVEEASTPVPIWAGVVLAAGAAAIQAAGQRAENGVDLVAGLLAVGGIGLLVVAIPRLMPPGFSRVGTGLPSVVWTRALVSGAFFGSESFIPLMLVRTQNLDLRTAGFILTIGSVGWMAGSWLQSRPWLPLRRDRIIVAGTLCVAVGVGAVGAAAWFGAPAWTVAVAWIPAGMGMGLATASTALATMALSEEHEQGRNSSGLQVGEGLGNAIFGGLAGTIFAVLHVGHTGAATFGTILTAMAVAAVLSIVSALRIGRVEVAVRTP